MTVVTVNKKNNWIKEVFVVGHSGYKSEGSDIICAGISATTITTVNACLRLHENSVNYEKKNGFLKLSIMVEDNIIDNLMENMLVILKDMQEQYPNYIKINEEVSL